MEESRGMELGEVKCRGGEIMLPLAVPLLQGKSDRLSSALNGSGSCAEE